ncbi:TPA: hypothetical protein QCK11_003396 [Enterobacter asburiae]|nr:hypothetical protein [Enterobacter asburiae]
MEISQYLLVGGNQNGDTLFSRHRNVGEKLVVVESRDDGRSINETYIVVSYHLNGHPDCLVAVCGNVSEKDILSAAKIALW